jgi:hypothetical protein
VAAIDPIEHHRLHVVGQHRCGHSAEELERVHHAVQQRLHILPLSELDILHPRPAQRQREAVKPLTIPVAEVAPVHLSLLARSGLEPNKRPLLALTAPRRYAALT